MTEVQATESLDTESPEARTAEAEIIEVAETAEQPESNTPGSILRRAREARGLSIADVVQVIRFSARQIEAMERDDYASLPGSTAVRGLVRNYAKLLKLDATPLLAQLDPAVPVPEADVRPPANMGEAEQPSIVERVPTAMIVLGAFILLSLLAGNWYFTQSDVSGVGSWIQRFGGTDGGMAATAPVQVPAPAAAPVPPPATAAGADLIAGNDPANAGAAANSGPSAGGLRVEFDDRSWIEIRDATQKIVYVGEYPAGTRQNVEGQAPFQVWIGKASGVRVYMGERSIDLKPHTREEIARFSLE